MATETRLIRPFGSVQGAQEVLERWVYKVGGEDWPPDASVSVAADEYVAARPQIVFNGDNEELAAARDELRTVFSAIGLTGDDVQALVVATTPRLKLQDVVLAQILGDEIELPSVVVIDPAKVRALRTPFGGCTIEFALCLSRDVGPDVAHPLRPQRKGTWLARSSLQLRTTAERAGFPVYPLTNEVRQTLRLTPATIRYVSLDASPLEPGDPSDLRVYLDEDLYARITAQPRTPGSRALQRELWVTAMTAIVLQAVRSPELDEIALEALDDSWLGRLLEWVAGPRRSDQRRWLDELKEQPAGFVSQIDVLAQRAADWRELV